MLRTCLPLLAVTAAIAAAAPAPAQEPPAQDLAEVDAKIVLAVDASRSMDLREFELQRQGYLQALRHPDLVRAIEVGRFGRIAFSYFEWSGGVEDGALVPWRIVATSADAAAFADEIATIPVERSRGTSISHALAFATVLLEDDRIVADRHIIDVSGDGANNSGPPVTGARNAAIERGITINGLPIMAFPGGAMANLDRYYEECVIGGIGAFVMVARDAETLASTIRRKLVIEVSGVMPEAQVIAAQFAEPIDCLIGEKLYQRRGFDIR